MISRLHNNLCKVLKTSTSLHAAPAKANRSFLAQIFPTVLFALLLVSFLIRSSSYLSLYHTPQVYHGAFSGRRFVPGSTSAAIMAHVQFVQPERLQTTYHEVGDEALHCDRSHMRTDVCVARGDVRVVGGEQAERVYEVVVYAETGGQEREEKMKPYTRKWEESVMKTIDEVKLLRKVNRHHHVIRSEDSDMNDHGHPAASDNYPTCDVQHDVPAILFSTGGYTGNVYHEFNDGLIPLFITAQKYKPAGQVVLLLLEYHDWWISKYAEILGQITNHTIIDLAADKRVHCFSEITVGLHIHDELAINDPARLIVQPDRGAGGAIRSTASMAGFQSMLHAAYLPRLSTNQVSTEQGPASLPGTSIVSMSKPKLVIISRNGPRALLNQKEVVALAEEIGFAVQVLSPTPTTEMVEIYGVLSGCDAMLGVHGAAMTHLVFMRPGATFIQVVPLGTDWAADTYYGEPARKLGLRYVGYKVSPRESSLWGSYASDDPVLVNPDSINSKGWWETKRIYLEGQNVTVSLPNMAAILRSAYARSAATLLLHGSSHESTPQPKHPL